MSKGLLRLYTHWTLQKKNYKTYANKGIGQYFPNHLILTILSSILENPFDVLYFFHFSYNKPSLIAFREKHSQKKLTKESKKKAKAMQMIKVR